ncbi:response regulator transcription factor [Herbiconiux sp. KACC 21604]|uniref:response regulator n=1 Tax=unclassified Herbiconiux TaxID=2618217 RepID=UPI00352F25D1|nr:response regulator transcription factor [Herbiconiux sp. KACC 21604]
MIRVVIADDQPLVRAGLAALIGSEDDIEVVGVAADGVEALELAVSLAPDVACLDIRMPGLDGIEVASRLCGPDADPAIPVLILTTFDIDDYVFRALEAGVSGFLLKDSDPDEIIRAIRSVAEGHGTLDRTLTRRVVDEYVQRRRLQPVTAARAVELLTAREREILLLLARA